jgi:hypothetical protein
MTDEPVYADAAAVAGLAREVEVLRRTVGGIDALSGRVDELAGLVARLAETSAASRPRSTGGAPTWLSGPLEFAEAVTVLAELTAWMTEVYLRYADGAAHLPECWLWHPDAVEELLWLWNAWLVAYRSESATVALAGDWHDRQRPGVVRRIRAVAGTCSLESHQPGGDRHRGAAPVPLAEAVHLIGDWWSGDRASRPPAPDASHIAAAAELRRPRRRG